MLFRSENLNQAKAKIQSTMDRIMARFSPEDCGKLEEILTVVSRELMPEVPLPERTEE